MIKVFTKDEVLAWLDEPAASVAVVIAEGDT